LNDQATKDASAQFEESTVKHVYFLSEQDGPSERNFKNRLESLFRSTAKVKSAYLVKVHYGDPRSTSVCLCIEPIGTQDKSIVEEVVAAFKSLFPATQHLDIIFPSSGQRAELASVCRPFFRQHPQ